ncbi:MAG: hypothetical protein ACREP9_20245, partial [Candidatus Dormibacteraceae bacterium]
MLNRFNTTIDQPTASFASLHPGRAQPKFIPQQLAFLFAKLFLWAMPKKKRLPGIEHNGQQDKTRLSKILSKRITHKMCYRPEKTNWQTDGSQLPALSA